MTNAILMAGIFAVLLLTQHPEPQWYHWLMVVGAFFITLFVGSQGRGGDAGGDGGGGC